ncbi:hypothetical protein [Ureaplasma zalophigenitalium]|uniref:Uncharacterized protein n=1 Tax=Ureaplasma zalophigenitalium TaxID=907723 RepID=A0ABT3BPB7_9BACT|nr:hypothetical protein [Ureaplasma zalophigenitalium]MCV3754054.1 hypothetical protein [Ureaplasma zalophigenitalium]
MYSADLSKIENLNKSLWTSKKQINQCLSSVLQNDEQSIKKRLYVEFLKDVRTIENELANKKDISYANLSQASQNAVANIQEFVYKTNSEFKNEIDNINAILEVIKKGKAFALFFIFPTLV